MLVSGKGNVYGRWKEAVRRGDEEGLGREMGRGRVSNHEMESLLCSAAGRGEVACLRLLISKRRREWEWREWRVVAEAAKRGEEGALRFLVEEAGFPVLPISLSFAARGGSVECLTYLHSSLPSRHRQYVPALLSSISAGTIRCFSYLLSSHPPHSVPSHVMSRAVRKGRKQFVEEMVGRGCKVFHETVCMAAEKGDSLLSLLLSSGGPMTSHVFLSAIYAGNEEGVKLLLQKKCPTTEDPILTAVTAGKQELVSLLFEAGFLPLPGSECVSLAAGMAREDLLSLLIQRGCEWKNNTVEEAALSGSMPCLRMAEEGGAPLPALLPSLSLSGNLHEKTVRCFEYLCERGCTPAEEDYALLKEIRKGVAKHNWKKVRRAAKLIAAARYWYYNVYAEGVSFQQGGRGRERDEIEYLGMI